MPDDISTKKTLKLSDCNTNIILGCLFIITLFVRVISAANVPINSSEARILLELSNSGTPDFALPIISIIYLKLIQAIGFTSPVVIRLVEIAAGSILMFLPLVLKKKLGNRTVLIMAVCLSLDPFFLINSVQVGSNIISLLIFSLFLVSIFKERRDLSYFLAAGYIFSGRGTFIGILVFLFLLVRSEKIKRFLFQHNPIRGGKVEKKKYFSTITLFAIFLAIFFFMDVNISIVIKDIIKSLYLSKVTIGLFFQNISYLLIPFISYFLTSLCIYVFARIVLRKTEPFQDEILYGWLNAAACLLLIIPGTKPFDLVWLSIPIDFSLGILINRLCQKIKPYRGKDFVFSSILVTFWVALSVSIGRLVSNNIVFYGSLEVYRTIGVIVGATLILMIIIWKKNKPQIILGSIIVMGLAINASILFRSTGLFGTYKKELLWSGDFENVDLIYQIIETEKDRKEDSTEQIRVYFDDGFSAIQWRVLSDPLIKTIEEESHSGEDQQILIFSNEKMDPLELGSKTIGMKYPLHEKPNWSNNPLGAFANIDYYKWLLFRNNILDKDFVYIYRSF